MPHESSSPVAHTFDCVSIVTNNHDLETSHRNVGGMVLDIFSAYRNNTECNTTTTVEGFTTTFSDLCGLSKPCGKDFEVWKPYYMMSRTGSSTKCDCLTRCSLENVAHEGDSYFISLKITLHRVHLQLKVQAETFWLFSRKRSASLKELKDEEEEKKNLILTKFFNMQKKKKFCHEWVWRILLISNCISKKLDDGH